MLLLIKVQLNTLTRQYIPCYVMFWLRLNIYEGDTIQVCNHARYDAPLHTRDTATSERVFA
jgi:hypothetical protein